MGESITYGGGGGVRATEPHRDVTEKPRKSILIL